MPLTPPKKGSVKQNILQATTAEVEACIKLLKAVDTLRKSNNNISNAHANNISRNVDDLTGIREEVTTLRPLVFELINDVKDLKNPPMENSKAAKSGLTILIRNMVCPKRVYYRHPCVHLLPFTFNNRENLHLQQIIVR